MDITKKQIECWLYLGEIGENQHQYFQTNGLKHHLSDAFAMVERWDYSVDLIVMNPVHLERVRAELKENFYTDCSVCHFIWYKKIIFDQNVPMDKGIVIAEQCNSYFPTRSISTFPIYPTYYP